jgi:G3E family GTPase
MMLTSLVECNAHMPKSQAWRRPLVRFCRRILSQRRRRETIAGMQQADPVPATVLTGFLGSGKTTLLRRALAAPALSDTAVVINELGAVAIDHHLVDFVEGMVVELPGGCLCCAVREDLARVLRDLFDRADAGAVKPFRRLVIETTGLADPAPILYTLGADPMLDARLALARVVALVDAVSGEATLDRFAEAQRQVAVADAIVISKTDLKPFGPRLARRLDALNSAASRLFGHQTRDSGAVLFGETPTPTLPRLRGRESVPPAPASGGGSGWGHAGEEPATHTHGIATFALSFGRAPGRLDFARALGGLAAARGNDLLRVKGILEFADRPGRPAVVQAAQHAMYAPHWLDDWPDDDRCGRLVFIVHDIPRDEILAHFAFAEPSLIS